MRKIWLIPGIILFCAAIAGGMIITYCKIARLFNPYNERQISGPIVITSDWTEIKPKQPLIMDRPVQEIVLALDKTIQLDPLNWKLLLSDGTSATPEVQLIDRSGNIYDLPGYSADERKGEVWLRGFGMGLVASQQLPAGTVFTTVRLRSDRSVRCSRISWRTYDPKDLK